MKILATVIIILGFSSPVDASAQLGTREVLLDNQTVEVVRLTYPAGSDTEAFMQDQISITPLQFDWTAGTLVTELRSWRLTPSTAR